MPTSVPVAIAVTGAERCRKPAASAARPPKNIDSGQTLAMPRPSTTSEASVPTR